MNRKLILNRKLIVLVVLCLAFMSVQANAQINNGLDDDLDTVLISIVRDANTPKVIEALISEGADVNAKNLNGYTALMEAGYSKNSKIVRALISAGADVNAKTDDDSGWTALLSAAHNGESPEIAKILISAGADINAKTEAGFRANVNAKDNTDYEPVLLKGDDLNKPKLLARKKHTAPHVGAIDNAQMYTGRNNSEIAKTTVLMYAAEKNNSEIVSIFIKAGAKDSIDEFGQNALMHAVERSNNPKIVKIIS